MENAKRRAQSPLENASGKIRGFPDPFHPCFQKSAADVLASECKDPGVYIPVKVVMVWRHDGNPTDCRRRVRFEDTLVERGPKQFEAIFSEKCMLFWHHLDLAINDMFLLSMKGASFTRIPLGRFNTIGIPFRLTYKDGCMVKFREQKGRLSDTVVDLWDVNDRALLDMDIVNAKDVVIVPPSIPDQHNALVPSESSPKVHEEKARSSSGDVHSMHVEAQPLTNPQNETSKKRKIREHLAKKLNSAKRKDKTTDLELKSYSAEVSVEPVASGSNSEVRMGTILDNKPVSELNRQQITRARTEQPTVESDIVELRQEDPQNPVTISKTGWSPLDLAAGWNEYRALGYVIYPEALGKNHSVIGVVTSSRDVTMSRGGDFSQSVCIIDPSNFLSSDAARYRCGAGLTVNLFTKGPSTWLPTPKEGDILILRAIKPTMNHHSEVNGVVYHDKLKWAIFDPDTGSLHHGDTSNAPTSERYDEGTGATFCPYFTPPAPQDELIYCQKLAEWWRAILAKRIKDLGVVHQIGSSRKFHRIHRLICDTTQESEPDGYFNCTIQVLQGFQNDNGVYSLYVTDYTPNSGLQLNDKWGDKLQDKVLKVEMWDAAATVGPTMVRNDFYALNNCRMMLKGGYLEAKQVENKIQRLQEDENFENEAFVKLLERKAQIDAESSVQPRIQCKFEDAEPERFFDCVVELLHKIDDKSGMFIFVTDYTLNNTFLGPAPSQPWAEGLDRRIVRVKVYGETNIKKAQGMPTGSFYRLDKLRFWKYSENWICHLKDIGTIFRMNAKAVNDDGLRDLLTRREEWKKSRGARSAATISSPDPKLSRTPSLPLGPLYFPRISKYPARFDARARVVDFYPKDLVGCLALHCGKCHKRLGRLLKACTVCTEATMQDAALEYRCTLVFILRDRMDKDIVAIAGDPCVSKRVSLIDLD